MLDGYNRLIPSLRNDMPPEKKESTPVDLTKMYGSAGPKTGVFSAVEHTVKRNNLDIIGLVVAMGILPSRKHALYVVAMLVGVALATAAFLYWSTLLDTPPPQIHRPAVDARAHA